MKFCAECGIELEEIEIRLCDSCQYEADIVAEELTFDHKSTRKRSYDDETPKSLWDELDGDDENMDGNEEALY